MIATALVIFVWLVLHLHDLFAADDLVGPHTLLLSGTSWAGTSPSYHVQVPVTGVLLAPDEEVAAINNSTFELKILLDRQQQPIGISGKTGQPHCQRSHSTNGSNSSVNFTITMDILLCFWGH